MTTFKYHGVKLFLCMLLGGLSTVVYSKASSIVTPSVLRGVWSVDNEMGREQCLSYKANKNYETLAGALVISKNRLREAAEYGEDDIYTVRHIKLLKNKKWRFQTLSDFYPYDTPKKRLTFELLLKNKKLHWTSSFMQDGKSIVQTWIYFKCV
jgi:hypothetical protein